MTAEKRNVVMLLMGVGLTMCFYSPTRALGGFFAGLGAGMLSREDR